MFEKDHVAMSSDSIDDRFNHYGEGGGFNPPAGGSRGGSDDHQQHKQDNKWLSKPTDIQRVKSCSVGHHGMEKTLKEAFGLESSTQIEWIKQEEEYHSGSVEHECGSEGYSGSRGKVVPEHPPTYLSSGQRGQIVQHRVSDTTQKDQSHNHRLHMPVVADALFVQIVAEEAESGIVKSGDGMKEGIEEAVPFSFKSYTAAPRKIHRQNSYCFDYQGEKNNIPQDRSGF